MEKYKDSMFGEYCETLENSFERIDLDFDIFSNFKGIIFKVYINIINFVRVIFGM